MKLPFKASPNHMIIISTLIILGLAYFLYLRVYIKNREESIIASKFRVLTQIGQNIRDKLDGLQQVPDILADKVRAEFFDNLEKYPGTSNDANKQQINKKLISDMTSFVENISERQFNNEIGLTGFRITVSGVNGVTFDYTADSDRGAPSDTIYIAGQNAGGFVTIRLRYDQMIKGILREDVFSKFLMIRDSSIIYSDFNAGFAISPEKSVDQTAAGTKDINTLEIPLPDKNVVRYGTLMAGSVHDISISKTDYKMFLEPLEIGGKTWYIGGLAETNGFNKEKRALSPWFILTLSFLLLLIILSLPLVKLRVITPTEHMTTGTIITSAFSVFLGGTLTLMFIFFMCHNLSRNHAGDKYLKSLADIIDSTFRSELTLIHAQLNDYDYHQLKSCGSDGADITPEVWRNILKDPTSAAYPKYYRYFDYLFWIDNNGKQTFQLTPFKNIPRLISVKDRAYFRNPDEWYFLDNKSRFRMESILSLRDISFKSGVAIRNTKNPGPGNGVLAMSTRMYSVIDPILPKDYHFSIIDASGMVWFHSTKERNLRENFIEECNNRKNLTSAIYSNVSKPFNISYYNKPHRAYIRPLGRLPLYLVTYYDQSPEQSFRMEVFTLTAVQMIALFGFLFLLILLVFFTNHIYHSNPYKNPLMEMTRPKEKHRDDYIFLCWLNICALLLFLVMAPFMKGIHGLLAVLMMISIMFTFAYHRLNGRKDLKKNRRLFIGLNSILLILLNLAGFHFLNKTEFTVLLLFQGLLILVLLLVHRLIKGNIKLWQPKSYIKNYLAFLVSLVVLFGGVPAMKFMESAFDAESAIRIRHTLADLMLQRENRNKMIANYYSACEDTPTIDQTEKERQEAGIYTRFMNDMHFISKGQTDQAISENPANPRFPFWDTLLCYFRPYYDRYITENKYLVFSPDEKHTDKMTWVTARSGKAVTLSYPGLTANQAGEETRFMVSSSIPDTRFMLPFSNEPIMISVFLNLLFWTALAVVIIFLFIVCRYGIIRLYSLHIVEMSFKTSFPVQLRRRLDAFGKVMLTRLTSYDNNGNMVREIFTTGEIKVFDWSDPQQLDETDNYINISGTPENGENDNADKTENGKPIILLIYNYDSSYRNIITFERCLGLFRQMLSKKDLRVIVVAKKNPDTILAYFQGKATDNDPWNPDTEKFKLLLHDFKQVTGRFSRMTIPVNFHGLHDSKVEKEKNQSIEFMVESELRGSAYLRRFENNIRDYLTELKNSKPPVQYKDEKDRILNLIATQAWDYYQSILDSCNDFEKYVIIDLAEDQILNPSNSRVIYGLIDKGILRNEDNTIMLMNESFRRFALKSLPRSMAVDLESRLNKEAGTWKGYKIMFSIVILAIFLFITITNPDFLSNMKELFVVLAAGMATITGILGFLSSKKKAASE